MKINFVLPELAQTPIGGYKLVYQYANWFVEHGHDVFVYHKLGDSNKPIPKLIRQIKRKIDFQKSSSTISWFNVDSRIHIVPGVYKDSQIRNADVIVATAAPTAEFVLKIRQEAGEKFYFIQNFENWGKYTDEMVYDTYRYPMTKIVISAWLAEFVKGATGKYPYVVQNFISKTDFFVSNQTKNRDNIISLLNHPQVTKRTNFGIEVLKKVKLRVPDLKVELFGAYEVPKNLPDWINYSYQPSVAKLRNIIYGKSKIYLMPSVLEGWGLTGMEAMACGAVPVASNYGGMLDFMDENNAVLVEKDNCIQFENAIIDLLNDQQRWEKLSDCSKLINDNYSIKRSAKKMLSIFNETRNNTQTK